MKKRLLIVMVAFALIAGFYGWAGAQTATKEDAMAMVERAGKLIEEKGDAALAAISDPKGEFINRKKALYVFVYDENIVVVAHPYLHELIGQCLKGKPDDQGRMFRDEIVGKALTKGSGWTEYSYQKPIESAEGEVLYQTKYKKNTYGKLFKYGDKKYIVCSGTYE
ncbi:cytochrome c [Syntrophus gentianae]|uniref:Cytochrome c n=1 Tax=Syntrophus gentianae TaxID=43775 RepID=A0A1H8A856_9BACT|nr:cache domain-containing protein [Syntrophus gentianae]SEM66870.1 cytochrome c [Syntrophus gentianae]